MNSILVTVVNVTLYIAVINSILKLTDDIHPNTHVSSSLLDSLSTSCIAVSIEVSVTVGERSRGSLKRSVNPLVSVVKLPIVVVELLKVLVWAPRTVIKHLRLCRSAESLDGTSILVVTIDAI